MILNTFNIMYISAMNLIKQSRHAYHSAANYSFFKQNTIYNYH